MAWLQLCFRSHGFSPWPVRTIAEILVKQRLVAFFKGERSIITAPNTGNKISALSARAQQDSNKFSRAIGHGPQGFHHMQEQFTAEIRRLATRP